MTIPNPQAKKEAPTMWPFSKRKNPDPGPAAISGPTAARRGVAPAITDGVGSSRWAANNPYLSEIIDANISEPWRITVSSLKGGVGKTTSVLGLGTALAQARRAGVTAIDANPHRGTLSERLGEEHAYTVRDLLDRADGIRTSTDYARYASQAQSRLEVVASEKSVEQQQSFSAQDYAEVLSIVSTFRPVILTDTGTDLLLPMMQAVYAMTDQLVVPCPVAADGFRLARETLDWWERHANNGAELVRNAVVPFVRVDHFELPNPASPPPTHEIQQMYAQWDAEQRHIEQQLTSQLMERGVRVVRPIPYDPALSKGHWFQWDELRPDTQAAFLMLAFDVAMGFPENQQWVGVPEDAATERIVARRKQQADHRTIIAARAHEAEQVALAPQPQYSQQYGQPQYGQPQPPAGYPQQHQQLPVHPGNGQAEGQFLADHGWGQQQAAAGQPSYQPSPPPYPVPPSPDASTGPQHQNTPPRAGN